MTEEQLCLALAQYIAQTYPLSIAHFDYGSGLKMTIGQATRQKRLNSRAYPDLFIAEPRVYKGKHYCGLFLELKREGTRLKKRDGSYASPHIVEQAAVLHALTLIGYVAQFAVGLTDAKRLVDSYMEPAS